MERMFSTIAATEVERAFRFHLLGLVHLPVSERYMGCAFTQKIVKMSKMLLDLGHEVYLYGAESSDAPCTEHIQTHTLKEIRDTWGDGDNRFDIGYNWKRSEFRHDFNDQATPLTEGVRGRCVAEIHRRKKDDDFLLVMQGDYQRPIADKIGLSLTVEPGIGYRGSYANYRAYESAYLQNFTHGSERPRQSIDGAYFHRVIPNYFDEKDFPFEPEKEDYYLFIGRVIKRKGIWTAIRTVGEVKGKLLVAGQESGGGIVRQLPPHCKYIGYIEPEQRAELMGKAKAVFVPTLYLEAFGGVNVEAQLCGTPVITTNFGVFPETVVQGITGFRCNTLQDFVDAAGLVEELDPQRIRAHAERYLMRNVKWEFQQFWEDLYRVYESQGKPEGTIWGWNYLRSYHDRPNGSS